MSQPSPLERAFKALEVWEESITSGGLDVAKEVAAHTDALAALRELEEREVVARIAKYDCGHDELMRPGTTKPKTRCPWEDNGLLMDVVALVRAFKEGE